MHDSEVLITASFMLSMCHAQNSDALKSFGALETIVFLYHYLHEPGDAGGVGSIKKTLQLR